METSNVMPNNQTQPITDTGTANYASFGVRFVAIFIDGLLLGLVSFALGLATAGNKDIATAANGLAYLVSWGYMVFMDVKYGATLGKMAMKIRVQNMSTGANLTVMEAILREVAGKFVSGITLGIGYLWMLWDPKKQTLHDKIAKSVVVKVG